MDTLLNFLKSIYYKTYKKRPYLTIIGAIVLIILGYIILKPSTQNVANLITVKKGTIAEEVDITGKTKASQSVNLAFERSGKIRLVNMDVGNRVVAGELLASLDSSELYAQLLQAQADLATQQSKLQQLKNGSRPEELAVYEIQLQNAATALIDAKNNVVQKIQDSYSKADDAVRNQADQFFSNSRSTTPTLAITAYDPQVKTDLESARPSIEHDLVAWKSKIDSLTVNDDLVLAINESSNNLNEIKMFLDKLAQPINQTASDADRTTVSSARTSLGTAIANLSTAKEKLNTAEANYMVAKKNLELKEAGTETNEVSAQTAQTERAQASIDLIQAQIAKTYLRAPLAGVITKMDAKTGEIAPANTPLVSIMSENSLEIEANASEVDIIKINIGDPVKITLDAMPNETFEGKVIYIDPAETVIDGVVNFKIRVAFSRTDERIKSGLTSNLGIETAVKNNALVLSQSAIIENDRGTFVKKTTRGEYQAGAVNVNNSQIQEVPVVTGIRSQDGRVEIVSGLNENDTVLNVGLKTQ